MSSVLFLWPFGNSLVLVTAYLSLLVHLMHVYKTYYRN